MNSDIAQLASLAHSQIPHPHVPEISHDDHTNGAKRKAEDGQQGSSKSRRSRYISLACNECKRRKIKCNGQSPCQRCGNLQLECVYAPNCCSGFKDSQEYKDIASLVASLQEQVHFLYENLNGLRTQLGHNAPMPQTQLHQPQYSQPPSIDPSLQAQSYAQHSASFNASSPEAGHDTSPQTRPKSGSQPQQSFRRLSNADFNFGVSKSSLQLNAGAGNDIDEVGGDIGDESNLQADTARNIQLYQHIHETKDPIWMVSKAEAQRLCQVYEDETRLMYPVVDVNRVLAYVDKLYQFLEAMRRSGLVQPSLPGTDGLEDEDTNVLKLILATALTAEGSGKSELGARFFERVQPAIDNLLLGNVTIKGIRLLVMTAVNEFQRSNEGTSWRLIGLAARLCVELGLHRRETYEAISDEAERQETVLLFWTCYVLDRRWSLSTGTSFVLQEVDIDLSLPRPDDRSPYLTAMVKYCEIGSNVWRSVAAPDYNSESMNHLDYQVLQWHHALPASLQFEHSYQQDRAQPIFETSALRAALCAQVVLYLKANQMRVLIHRPIIQSATSITLHREQAQKTADLAKDTIRVLAYINQMTDLFRNQQGVFHAFLTSALAVFLLVLSHAPTLFAESVREEFFLAVELVRVLSRGSLASKRLSRTIRDLKDAAAKLGLRHNQKISTTNTVKQPSKDDIDPSRSAAVAMAGLAGHNVDEMTLFNQEDTHAYSTDAESMDNPDYLANELAGLFEAAGVQSTDTTGAVDENSLSSVLKELF